MNVVTDPEEFPCPKCGEMLAALNEDLDDPGIFVCHECDWYGPWPESDDV